CSNPYAPSRYMRSTLLRAEALAILARAEEGLDHLSRHVIAVELIELRQPEVESVQVAVRILARIASQVTEILHLHKSAIEFAAMECRILGDAQQRAPTGSGIGCS